MIDTNSGMDDIQKFILHNDTTPEADITPHNEGNSHEAQHEETKAPNETNNESIAHVAQRDNQFSAFDSLRHGFDTHKQINPTEYIGGLFARGGITVIAGASGVGKTTLEQLIIHELSLGGSILSGFTHEPKPCKSIIIAGELGEKGLIERAQEYGWHSDMNFVEVIDLLDFEEKGHSLIINEEKGKANIEHLAQTPALDVLFFDSFGMFYTGKETDNDALRGVFHWLLSIARKYNIAIVIIHHSRKRLSSEQQKPLTLDDLIGGNAISRYAHRVITVEYNSKYETNFVTCRKSWGAYFKTFSYKKHKPFYDGGEPYLEINLDPGEIEIENKKSTATVSNAEIQRNTIIAILKAKEGNQATTKEIRELLGISENDEKEIKNLGMQLSRMAKNKDIIRVKQGVYALPEPEQTQEENNTEQAIDDSPSINFEENDSE